MDERTDLVRTLTDGRYVYVRNYVPDLPSGQHVAYMFETPTTRVWADLHRNGRLSPEQAAFWRPRPAEELYDLDRDSDEVRNLAAAPEHRRRLLRFRRALRDHLSRIRDVGFLPEAELLARAGGDSPYDLARNPGRLKVNDVIDAAGFASEAWRPGRAPDPNRVNRLLQLTKSGEAGVRYWAVVGLRLEGEDGVRAAAERLASLLNDKSPSVRVAAGEALGLFGSEAQRRTATEVLLRHAHVEQNEYFVAVAALQALDRLGPRAADRAAEIRALPATKAGMSPRLKEYSGRLVEHLRRNLGAQSD